MGRIRDKLEELDILEDTILVFLSDAGCHFKTRNWEHKRSCHDASIHITLIIQSPAFSGGREINKLVNLIDMPPTLLEMAFVAIPSRMQSGPLQVLVSNTHAD